MSRKAINPNRPELPRTSEGVLLEAREVVDAIARGLEAAPAVEGDGHRRAKVRAMLGRRS